MNRRALQLVALGGLLTVGAQLQAHHAVAGVYDLNKEIVLEGPLTRQGLNKTSIKPGESLKITALPARNGNPAGFIRRLELGDKEFNLVIE